MLRVPGSLRLGGVAADGTVLLSHDMARRGVSAIARGETREQFAVIALGLAGVARAATGLDRRQDRTHGVGPADAVGVETAVGLEVLQRAGTARTEDAVDATAVESEASETDLQVGDIVAAHVR